MDFFGTPHLVYAAAIVLGAIFLAYGLSKLGAGISQGLQAGQQAVLVYQNAEAGTRELTEIREIMMLGTELVSNYNLTPGWTVIRVESIRRADSMRRDFRVTLAQFKKQQV